MISALLALPLLLSAPTVPGMQSTLEVHAQPAAQQTAARGATRVPMLTLTMRASCEASVRLNSITLYHDGLGNPRDLSAVYVLENGQRVTRSTMPSSREGKLTLRTRGIALKACESRTFTVAADLSQNAAASGLHGLTLRSGEDIDAGDASVSAAIDPMTSSVKAAATQQGTISSAMLSLPRRLTYGPNRIVARVRLESDGDNRQYIDAITFTNDGKARDTDLQNLWLGTLRKERLSSTLISMDGAKARIVFEEPLLLDRHDAITLELHADIRASRTRTVEWNIEETSDIEFRTANGRLSK